MITDRVECGGALVHRQVAVKIDGFPDQAGGFARASPIPHPGAAAAGVLAVGGLAAALPAAASPTAHPAAPAPGAVQPAGTVTPAAAKSCAGAASKRIGGEPTVIRTRSLVWGTAEWRYGTSGSCYQRKWIVVHITRSGLYLKFESERNRFTEDDGDGYQSCGWGLYVWDRSNINWGGDKCWSSGGHPVDQTAYHVGVGTWTSYAYYGYGKSLAGDIYGHTTKGNALYFGAGGQYND